MDEVDFSDLLTDKYNLTAPFATQKKSEKLVGIGKKFFEQRDYKNALLNFEKAVGFERGVFKADILFYKGVTLLNLRKTSEAMKTFQDAVLINPNIRSRIDDLFRRGPAKM